MIPITTRMLSWSYQTNMTWTLNWDEFKADMITEQYVFIPYQNFTDTMDRWLKERQSVSMWIPYNHHIIFTCEQLAIEFKLAFSEELAISA